MKVTNLGVQLQGQDILQEVSFQLNRGTTLAIVGPNGAGKTVLLRALMNLVPHKGRIEWQKGVRIGYVPQRLSVTDVPVSVRDFLSFKGPFDTRKALSLVGLESEAITNKTLGVLSGGQLQRVLIAWAIVDRPNVLLFDEPTNSVDLDSEEAVYRMLRRLQIEQGITTLLISHEVHIVKDYSDVMLALNKCVKFFGKSKAIMDPSLQELIYGEPVCVTDDAVVKEQGGSSPS